MEDYESQAKFFKVLMHPARLAILDILRDGEQCVCHLEAILELRQAYISQQLMILRESGLVQDRRNGWNIYYRVVNSGVFEIIDQARKITGSDKEMLQPTQKRRTIQADCQCPKCHPSVEPITA
jgi:DNA-binding transcriptional ArsR family regulator